MSSEIRVLHVDDEPEFAALTARLLESIDDRFVVSTAVGPDEGCRLVETESVDCIVSDYDMPGQNGVDFLHRLREVRPSLPFILFTGKGSEEVASDAISAGVTDYLQKSAGTEQYTVLANRIINAVERVRAKETAEATEQQLSAVHERIADGFVAVDTDWICTDGNDTGAQLLGTTLRELRGDALWDVVPALAESSFGSALREAMETQTPMSRETACEPLDRWFAVRVYPDSDGLSVYFHDVTDRQHQQQALADSEEKYRSFVEDVLDLSHVGTFILDATFSVVWINRGIEQYFGIDRDSVIGRDKRKLITKQIKHRFAAPDRFAETVIATYDDNTYVEQFECQILPTDTRDERWLEHWSYPISEGPYAGGRIEHYADITERKHREQELSAERELLDRLLNTSPIGIVIFDADGTILRANQQAEDVFGHTGQDLIGRTYDDWAWEICDSTGAKIKREELPVSRVLQTGESVYGHKQLIAVEGGEERWISVNAAPLLTPESTISRVICTVSDITADRTAEQRLAQQNQQLAEFASIASHDLRNPLNVLGGSLELAAETGDEAHFERSRRAIDRMAQLIDDLLVLAHQGEQIDATESVTISELVTDCWQQISTPEATLHVETDRVVTADRSRLVQLFENLFRNSVDHGGEHVVVTVGDCPGGIYVADNGPGIPSANREQVFDRGYSTTRTGTGLGLYIVRQVADAHGWHIDLTEGDTGGARIELLNLA